MLQRLPIALAQLKAGNVWKLTKWNQTNFVFSVLSKTKKVYNNVMN